MNLHLTLTDGSQSKEHLKLGITLPFEQVGNSVWQVDMGLMLGEGKLDQVLERVIASKCVWVCVGNFVQEPMRESKAGIQC